MNEFEENAIRTSKRAPTCNLKGRLTLVADATTVEVVLDRARNNSRSVSSELLALVQMGINRYEALEEELVKSKTIETVVERVLVQKQLSTFKEDTVVENLKVNERVIDVSGVPTDQEVLVDEKELNDICSNVKRRVGQHDLSTKNVDDRLTRVDFFEILILYDLLENYSCNTYPKKGSNKRASIRRGMKNFKDVHKFEEWLSELGDRKFPVDLLGIWHKLYMRDSYLK